jgi:hypothetical protein
VIGKIALLFRTVRHLKLRQIAYQVFYRVKPRHNLSHYLLKTKESGFKPVAFINNYDVQGLARPDNSFCFLNLEQKFAGEVNWNFQGHGKLWNYNLQYFNFLQQKDLPQPTKLKWLTDISGWLKNGKLPLEPYPTSLRVINIIRYASYTKEIGTGIAADTFAQLAYLNDNLEYHILGNHLLENAFALFIGGYVFDVENWRQKAKDVLYNQLDEQILNDGAHFELSPMYHQIIFFRLLELIDWYSNTLGYDEEFLNFTRKKASLMLGWLKAITFKNGNIPHFNDSADGIALTSSKLFLFAQKLEIAADEIRLNESGYRKYVGDKYECVIDAAPVGPSYQPGHAHSDALSFILYSNQEPLFVDTGTSTYQVNNRRAHERSTGAHNTVEINGANQSEVWGGFRVGRRAKVTILSESADTIIAQHDGYLKTLGAIHKRSFNFAGGKMLISDSVSADLRSTALFHVYPTYFVEIAAENKISIKNMAVMNFKGADNIKLLPYQFAAGYNKYSDGVCICVEFKHDLQTEIAFA